MVKVSQLGILMKAGIKVSLAQPGGRRDQHPEISRFFRDVFVLPLPVADRLLPAEA